MKQHIAATVRIVITQDEIVTEEVVGKALAKRFPDAEHLSVTFDGGFSAGYNDADSRHRYPDNSGQ